MIKWAIVTGTSHRACKQWSSVSLYLSTPHLCLPAGVLFKFGVDTFNEEAEKQDKLDGYTK